MQLSPIGHRCGLAKRRTIFYIDLVDRLDVFTRTAVLVEGPAEEGVCYRLCKFRPDDARAHGDDLRIVERRAFSGISVMGQCGANAGHLVGGDADADAGAAYVDRAVIIGPEHGRADAVGEMGVKGVRTGISAEYFMYLVAVLEVIGEDLCQAFACAIAGYSEFPCRVLLNRWGAGR